MENHPVPQNISSYEFRLVGDMTLKQFLQLAGGIIVGVLFLRLDLLPIIKWALAFLSFLFGFMMAFIPINARPFSAWLMAFIKAIYSPTEFTWIPDSIANPPPPTTPTVPVASPPTPTTPAIITPTPPTPPPAAAPVSGQVTSTPIVLNTPPPPMPVISTPAPPIIPSLLNQTTESKITHFGGISEAPIQSAASKQIPVPPKPAMQTVPAVAAGESPVSYVAPVKMPTVTSVSSAPQAASTPLVSPPTRANILAGLITDNQNQPLGNTTVEIIDTGTGIPARALRTNKLGQFQIAIPLPSGTYNIVVENDNYKFNPVSVQIKGSVVPPVIISALK